MHKSDKFRTNQEIITHTHTHTRSSNIELFRILTMLLIVAHHYVVNSGLTSANGPIAANPLAWRSLFLTMFGAFGKTGINCFVLISGYFMCRSHITAKKFCKLFFEILFYRIVIWCIFLISGYEAFSLNGLVSILLPIRRIADGFTSCYLVFFLFIPFLNILTAHMTQKQHLLLLGLLFAMYTILGTLPGFGVTMNYVSWFIVLYFIGAYLRIYPHPLFESTRFVGWSTLFLLLASLGSIVIFTWLGKGSYLLLADSNKLFALLLAISAFLFFKNLKMRNSKFINTISASTFGVLLIHASSDTMRRWLWQDVLNNTGMYSSVWMPIHAIGSVVIIFCVCTAIDYLRIRLLETPFFHLWDRHFDKFKGQYDKIENTICSKFKIQNKQE